MAVQLAPIDTKVRLPAAVVAATARATQLQQEMLETPSPSPEPPPAGTATASPPPAPAPPENELEHKLRSTEGRLRAAERERQTLSARLAALEQRRPAPTPAAEPTIEVKKLLTPEEIEEYGESFLDVVRRQAREELASEMFKVQRQITDLSGKVGNVSQSVAVDVREKMKTDLDQALPSWRTINYDEKFTSWLALQDPLSGYIRHDMLKSAWAANRTQQVLNFFKAYVAEEAAGSPSSPGTGTPPTPPAPGNGSQPAKIPLESLAAPGRAGSAAAPTPADKPIITRAQVTQFYADAAAGKYRGREAEKLENDAAIILAANEGRIV